jgi:hypothetical protein
LKELELAHNKLTKPQSPAVEAWLAALRRDDCHVRLREIDSFY